MAGNPKDDGSERGYCELWKAYRAGDLSAFDSLHPRLIHPAMNYARMLAGPDHAEDAVQMAWVGVLNDPDSLDGIETDAHFKAFFFRIVANKCADCWRSKRPGALPEDIQDHTLGSFLEITGYLREEFQQFVLRVSTCFQRLTLPQRVLLVMHSDFNYLREVLPELADLQGDKIREFFLASWGPATGNEIWDAARHRVQLPSAQNSLRDRARKDFLKCIRLIDNTAAER